MKCLSIILQLSVIQINQLLLFPPAHTIRLVINQHDLIPFQKISVYDSLHKHTFLGIPCLIYFSSTSGNDKRLFPEKKPR